MRMLTKQLMKQTWSALNMEDISNFNSRQHFEDIFAELGEVDAEASATYVCRQTSQEPFSPDNI